MFSLELCTNNLTQSLFYDKVLNISCNLFNTVLKVKKKKKNDYVGTDGCKCVGCSPRDYGADWQQQLTAIAQYCKNIDCISLNQEKSKISKFEV